MCNLQQPSIREKIILRHMVPADQQDKCGVVSLEPDQWDQWLSGALAQAEELITVLALETFRHDTVDPAKQVALL